MGVRYGGKGQWPRSHISCPRSHERDLSNPTGTVGLLRSDKFSPYFNLNDIGYTHLMVNHSENFVDPYTGAHTNTMEGVWNAVKKKIEENVWHIQAPVTQLPG